MKHPKIIRPTKLTLALPEDIRARLDLHLFSEVEQRIPFGAYQRFFVERVQEFFSGRVYVPADRKRILCLLIKEALSDLPQEWWVDNFQNPEAAYLAASELAETLK